MAIVVLLSFLTTVVSVPVLAKPKKAQLTEEAQEHFRTATAAFKKGDFIKAGIEFMIAYSKSGRPDALFNAGRAYQEAKMFEEATTLFEEYMRRSDATPAGIIDAERHIKTMKEQMGKQTKPPTVVTPPDPPKALPVEAPRDPTPVAVSLPPAPTPVVVHPHIPDAAPTRILPWVLVGTGSLIAIAGTTGLFLAEGQIRGANGSDVDWSAADANKIYEEKIASAKEVRLYSGIGLGIGLATAGVGVWQLMVSTPSPKTPIVQPVVLKQGGGVLLAWRW